MVLKYQISPDATRLENLVVKIYEAQNDNPGAEVYEIVIPERDGAGVPTPGAGHQVPYTVTANGLDRVVHVVRLYGETSAELLHEYNAEPKENVATVFDPIRFKIGDGGLYTPVADTGTYTNPILNGLGDEDYMVFRNQYGIYFPGLHYTTDPLNDLFALEAPDVFDANSEWVIIRKTKVITNVVHDSVVGKWFGGFVDIGADLSYLPVHLRKLLRFVGENKFTFAVDAQVPVGYGFCFQNFGPGASGEFGTVEFLNAPLLWNGVLKTEIDIPLFTEACFVFDGVNWNVVYFVTSDFANDPVVLPGAIIGQGNFFVGDVAGGDPVYEIIHAKNIAGDYNVYISIKSNDPATAFRNNRIGSSWYHHPTLKPNRFYVTLQEINGETQNLSISWLIVKL